MNITMLFLNGQSLSSICYLITDKPSTQTSLM